MYKLSQNTATLSISSECVLIVIVLALCPSLQNVCNVLLKMQLPTHAKLGCRWLTFPREEWDYYYSTALIKAVKYHVLCPYLP